MRIALTIILSAILHYNAAAITEYFSGDTLVNWAKGGLNIRMDKNLSSKKIGLIPYGESVIVQESKIGEWNDDIDVVLIPESIVKGVDYPSYSLNGKWAKVKFANQIGYVFDGYLSKYEAPKFVADKNRQRLESLDEYLKREFGTVSKSEGKYIKDVDAIVSLTEYKKGIFEKKIASKSAYRKYILPNFSLEEIILYIKYSVFLNPKETDNGIFKNSIDNETGCRKITILPSFENDGQISITYFRGVVIIEYEAWC